MRTARIILLIIVILIVAAVVSAIEHQRGLGTIAPTPLATSTPVATSTPATSSSFDIYAADAGKTFTYPVTSRFSVYLDPAQYPKASLACSPAGVIGPISNVPSQVPAGLYVARFEGLQPGSCLLSDKDFSVKIVITD